MKTQSAPGLAPAASPTLCQPTGGRGVLSLWTHSQKCQFKIRKGTRPFCSSDQENLLRRPQLVVFLKILFQSKMFTFYNNPEHFLTLDNLIC